MIASARTRYLGVIGFPIAHSYSPEIQEAAFSALDLDLRYGAFPVEPGRIGEAIVGAAALGFVGLNVTLPHKETALALCRPDDTATRIGAVNTLVYDDPARPPRGLNTDAHGFRSLLREAEIDAGGMRVVILGAGGAARAAVFALLQEGAIPTVISRSARRIAFDQIHDGPPISHVSWDEATLGRLLSTCDLLVDATPRGLDANARWDVAPLPSHAAVIDMAVRRETALVVAARARGLRAFAGAAMLVHQGAAAFEAWTGLPAPLEIMRGALDAALANTVVSDGKLATAPK